ncbi:hypothetical protein ACQ1ZK_14905, partial [Enterococcus faecium]
ALLKQLRPHMTTLVDAFAIPAGWKAAAILEQEPGRQEAMAALDAELRREQGAVGWVGGPGATATDLDVPPGQ